MDNIKKTELNHLQADLADEMSHYAQFKALLVLAFIVTNSGNRLLNRAMSNIQPVNTRQPTQITKTLAACGIFLVSVKLGISLDSNFRILFYNTFHIIIIAGQNLQLFFPVKICCNSYYNTLKTDNNICGITLR